jgi:hypothetical protein
MSTSTTILVINNPLEEMYIADEGPVDTGRVQYDLRFTKNFQY